MVNQLVGIFPAFQGPQGPPGIQGPPGPFPQVFYFSVLVTDAPTIDVDLSAPDVASFKIRIYTVVKGGGFNPPTMGKGVRLLPHINRNIPPAANPQYSDGVAVEADWTNTNPSPPALIVPSTTIGDLPSKIPDCVRSGDLIEATFERCFPPSMTPGQILHISLARYSPTDEEYTQWFKGFVWADVTHPIISVGLELVVVGATGEGDPAPLFDQTVSVASKIENSY